MGRKKTIEDDILIALIDRFFLEECFEDSKGLKRSEITSYIQQNGYPSFRPHLLDHNEAAQRHLTKLKSRVSAEDDRSVVTYQTLNVSEFLDANKSRKALTAALSQRDEYYRNVAETAARAIKQCESLNEALDNLKRDNKKLKESNEDLESKVKQLRKELWDSQKEQQKLKSIVDDYVYPDIATELMRKDNDVSDSTQTIIDEEKLAEKTITADTIIPSPQKDPIPFDNNADYSPIKEGDIIDQMVRQVESIDVKKNSEESSSDE